MTDGPADTGRATAATPHRTDDPRPEPGPRAVRVSLAPTAADADQPPLVVDPEAPPNERLEWFDAIHADVIDPTGDRRAVLLLPPESAAPAHPPGTVRHEVVVDGWRVEVEVEPARRAVLRERARRGREQTAHGGPTEVHAIIPGRVLSVAVVPGDPVEAGQPLVVVEAMKMQNELRSPRDGVIARVAVGAGETIEVGDLLVTLE